MTANEIVLFAGKAGDLEMSDEVRQALELKDGDMVEVVIRRTKAKPKATLSPEIMMKNNFFIRAV